MLSPKQTCINCDNNAHYRSTSNYVFHVYRDVELDFPAQFFFFISWIIVSWICPGFDIF